MLLPSPQLVLRWVTRNRDETVLSAVARSPFPDWNDPRVDAERAMRERRAPSKLANEGLTPSFRAVPSVDLRLVSGTRGMMWARKHLVWHRKRGCHKRLRSMSRTRSAQRYRGDTDLQLNGEGPVTRY